MSHRPQRLGPVAAMSLVAGSMLGIGIFIAPPVVASHVDRPAAFLLVWLLGGISALCGALSVAELGAMMPRAGGDYPYLRRAYGPGLAFAAGWLQLLAVFPGSLAAMAVGTATFQLPQILGSHFELPAQLGLDPTLFWATTLVLGLTVVNHIGVVVSGRLQIVVTIAPVLLLLLGTVFVMLHQGTHAGALATAEPGLRVPPVAALAAAFLPVYFAFSGWNAAIFVGAEIDAPSRNVPRALVGGTMAVTVLYVALCLGFLAVFTMSALANTGEAGTAAAAVIFGEWGRWGVTIAILLAMLGSLNGTVLTGSRIAYAMAKDGHCIAAAGTCSPRHGTPAVALWMQAGWTLLLIYTHGFEALIGYASAAMLITGTLTVAAVFVLRVKLPGMPRPYRTWGYPIAPAIYILLSLVVLVVLARKLDPSVFAGAGWFALAYLFHRFVMRPREAASSSRSEPRGELDAHSVGVGDP
ncbi:MAG: amino acid permease [Deltaproteobacteria bacterium]|nr:amino acid permease [Deltaproteobacteria bacterium]MBP7289575.1 amino acid permease [Nannocystaceae bacterium]